MQLFQVSLLRRVYVLVDLLDVALYAVHDAAPLFLCPLRGTQLHDPLEVCVDALQPRADLVHEVVQLTVCSRGCT
jgi:hypothetical protein